MKTPLHLNIGLTTNTGHKLASNYALWAAAGIGNVLASRIIHGPDEDCLAVSLIPACDDYAPFVHRAALNLWQDCIAVLDGGQGLLIGPGADKWGAFNPAAFIHPSTGLPLEVAPRVLPESDCQARQREAREKLANVEPATFNDYTRERFVEYLQETLIPDLKDSGSDATAEDFETAVHFILNR